MKCYCIKIASTINDLLYASVYKKSWQNTYNMEITYFTPYILFIPNKA